MRHLFLVVALATSVASLSFLEKAQGYLSGGASADASVSVGASGGSSISGNNWLAGLQNTSFGQAVAGGIDFYNNVKSGNQTDQWQQQLANSSFGNMVQTGINFFNNNNGSFFNTTAIQQQVANSSFGETFQAGVDFWNNMKNGNEGKQTEILAMFMPFLANASAEAQTEFNALVPKFGEMTIQEYETAVDAWAVKYGLTAEVEAYSTRAENASAQAEAHANAVVMNLPNVLANLKAIRNDKNQTIVQMHNRTMEYVLSLDEDTQDIVLVLFGNFLPTQYKTMKCNGGGNFLSNMYNQAVQFFSGDNDSKTGGGQKVGGGGAFSFFGGGAFGGNNNGSTHPMIGLISNFMNKNNLSESDVNSAINGGASIQVMPAVALGSEMHLAVETKTTKKNKQQQNAKKNQNKKKKTTTVSPVLGDPQPEVMQIQVL